MITLKNISKCYRGAMYETVVFDNMSLEIKDGDFACIMGKSGSGKSTLLHIIGCLDYPDKGEYYLDGVDINGLSSRAFDRYRKEKLGFIFQNYELMNRYTLRENIELPLNVRHIGHWEKRKRVNDIMDKLGIIGLAEKYPNQVSGGERQRAAIARAYVMDTKYILADEPTGALDEDNTAQIMDMFRALNNEGKTIVLVTHDTDIAGYGDYTVFLEHNNVEIKTDEAVQ